MNSDDFFNYVFAVVLAVMCIALIIHITISANCKLYGGCYYPQASIELKGE